MGSFSLKNPAIVDKIKKDIISAQVGLDKSLLKKMNAIVDVVYNTARARRPYITKPMHVAMGRNPKTYRETKVSDPNASAGVPVRAKNGGDLQISIQKEITKKGDKLTGRIFVQGPGEEYAPYMEFGTPHVKARPFLRPAVNLNKEWIKRKWNEPNS